MTESSFLDFSFDNEFEAEVYAKWFLRLHLDSLESEFSSDEWKKFLSRRELRLKAELDDLLELNFSSAHVCSLQKKSLFKIAKEIHHSPLNSEGSFLKNSRFNYKNIQQMHNKVIYMGQDRQCCYGELFHYFPLIRETSFDPNQFFSV